MKPLKTLKSGVKYYKKYATKNMLPKIFYKKYTGLEKLGCRTIRESNRGSRSISRSRSNPRNVYIVQRQNTCTGMSKLRLDQARDAVRTQCTG